VADPKGGSPADAARSALRKSREEQARKAAGIPSLHLLIWAAPQSMRLSLVLYHSLPGQRRSCTVLRQAEWRPQRVSEKDLVEWGRRALADWLENPSEEHVTGGPWPLP